MKKYKNYFCQPDVEYYSVDIFDTVLLRGHECELYRFEKLAELWKSGLELENSVWEIFLSRVEAARVAYHTHGDSFSREPTIEYIYEIMFYTLGYEISESLIGKALEIELAYEKTTLKPNLPLINFLKEKQREGRTILGISDMYLSSKSISELVYRNGEALQFDHLFSSADESESKRQGNLYTLVLDKLDIDVGSILHCGDNYHSDYAMAVNRGIRAVHTPRNPIWNVKTRVSHYQMLKKMGIA